MVIKNYKLLCEYLGQDIKTGKSREYQLKEWKRYFNWEKDGHKYIITKIYDKPLEQKILAGNHQIYVKNIELILQDFLSKKRGYRVELSLNELFTVLGITNNKYQKMTNKEFQEIDKCLDDFQIRHYNQRTYQKFRKIIVSSLNSLQNRRLINYKFIYYINEDINVNGKIQKITRLASESEENNIRRIEREVLKLMGLKNMNQVHLHFREKEFYRKIEELLFKYYNINYYFIKIRILFNNNQILEGLNETKNELQEEIIKEEKYKLNNKVFDAVNKQAENIFANNRDKYNEEYEKLKEKCWGNPDLIEVNKIFKLPDVYLYAQKKLAELTILLGDN